MEERHVQAIVGSVLMLGAAIQWTAALMIAPRAEAAVLVITSLVFAIPAGRLLRRSGQPPQ